MFLTFSEANKKLHDTNDDLRAALEVKVFLEQIIQYKGRRKGYLLIKNISCTVISQLS